MLIKEVNDIQINALRGEADIINNLCFQIDNEILNINLNKAVQGQYNIRCIFEKVSEKLSYEDCVLGSLLGEQYLTDYLIYDYSKILLLSPFAKFYQQVKLNFNGVYNIGVKVFVDEPLNNYAALDAIPIPTNLITIYIFFDENRNTKSKTVSAIQKHFDAYSHLGFFLADLESMRKIVENVYGSKELDLVHEFSNTEIIEKLFRSETFMIAWGINPYTYPIYSTKNITVIEPLLGKEFREEGVFNIREDIKELSLVPGHELANWPAFLSKEWPKIGLEGKGKTVFLKPFCLEDEDSETVVTSFLIYRDGQNVKEAEPLINVDLLYS